VPDGAEGERSAAAVGHKAQVAALKHKFDSRIRTWDYVTGDPRLIALDKHPQIDPEVSMLEPKPMILGRIMLVEKRVEHEHGQLPLVLLSEGGFGFGYDLFGYPVPRIDTLIRWLPAALGVRVSCHCRDLHVSPSWMPRPRAVSITPVA
jgi:hypothetical protein